MIVKQAAHVLDLFEFFAQHRQPANLVEISEHFNWPRSSTFNLLTTLLEKGYLYEPRSRAGYYPTPRWLTIAKTISDVEPLPEWTHSLIAELSADTGETAAIAAPAGTMAVFIDVIEFDRSDPILRGDRPPHSNPCHRERASAAPAVFAGRAQFALPENRIQTMGARNPDQRGSRGAGASEINRAWLLQQLRRLQPRSGRGGDADTARRAATLDHRRRPGIPHASQNAELCGYVEGPDRTAHAGGLEAGESRQIIKVTPRLACQAINAG